MQRKISLDFLKAGLSRKPIYKRYYPGQVRMAYLLNILPFLKIKSKKIKRRFYFLALFLFLTIKNKKNGILMVNLFDVLPVCKIRS